jgi:thiol-disulfide isomerase/thioredoxin
MSNITAGALTLIGAIAILNLVLTLAVIRRLRSLSTGHTGHTGHDDATTETAVLPATGFTVGSVTQAADLATGRHTVIMITPSCPPCKTMLGELESDVDSYADDALVCVVGTSEDLKPISGRLTGYRTISIAEELAESAFRVKGFPAVLSIENGVVTRAGHELPVKV